MTIHKVTIFSVAALAAAAAAIGIALAVMSVQADDPYPTIPTWPSFTMVYEADGIAVTAKNYQGEITREVRQLKYVTKTNWTDTVLKAPTITTPVGQFTRTGSYARMNGSTFTEYDASTGTTHSQSVPTDTTIGTSSIMLPFPIEESNLSFTATPTTARVCFHNKCKENAQGLMYVKANGTHMVFVDDARGIPLRVSDAFIVSEIQINDTQEPVSIDN
jgi:hypothetical protein